MGEKCLRKGLIFVAAAASAPGLSPFSQPISLLSPKPVPTQAFLEMKSRQQPCRTVFCDCLSEEVK